MNSECRICRSATTLLARFEPPLVTSTGRVFDLGKSVEYCPLCNHLQSPTVLDTESFYDTDYRLSLESEDHDQLLTTASGEQVFRSDEQARVILEVLGPSNGQALLDFGAAKGMTARALSGMRPDLRLSVFDVSDSYVAHWQWLGPDRSASYELPTAWVASFDHVLLNFVLEHVEDPCGVVRTAAGLLAEHGSLLLIVPDTQANMGDLLVVDHINFFSTDSMVALARQAGLHVAALSRDLISGAVVVVMSRQPSTKDVVSIQHVGVRANNVAMLAQRVDALVDIRNELVGRRFVIYGAGFYGALAASRLGLPEAFVDYNPRLNGTSFMGVPVLTPKHFDLTVDTVVVALNPALARGVFADYVSSFAWWGSAHLAFAF